MEDVRAITGGGRIQITVNLILMCVVTGLMLMALTTALPALMGDMQIPATTAQWLTSAYNLVMGVTMLSTGFLITRFPSKRLYLVCIGVFMAGLALCGMAGGFVTLLIGRLLQAFGQGAITALAQVVLLTIFPPEERGTAMGWYGVSLGAVPVLSPTIGGIVTDTIGWRMLFWGDLILVVLLLIHAVIVFADVLETQKKSFDMLSFFLGAVAFCGLSIGIANISSGELLQLRSGGVFLLGVLGTLLFIRRQRRLAQPFLSLDTFRQKFYTIAVISGFLLYLTGMAATVVMPLWLQSVFGCSASEAGLITLPGSLVMLVLGPIAGRLYDKHGIEGIYLIGAICSVVGHGGLALLDASASTVVIVLLYCVRAIPMGLLLTPLVTWGIGSLAVLQKPGIAADGTALLTSIRNVGGAIGASAFVGIMSAVAARSPAENALGASVRGAAAAFWLMTLVSVPLFWFYVRIRRARRNSA